MCESALRFPGCTWVPDEAAEEADASDDGMSSVSASGFCTIADECPNSITKTSPGVCGCATSDVDQDGDGVPDCVDEKPEDATNSNYVPFFTEDGISNLNATTNVGDACYVDDAYGNKTACSNKKECKWTSYDAETLIGNGDTFSTNETYEFIEPTRCFRDEVAVYVYCNFLVGNLCGGGLLRSLNAV